MEQERKQEIALMRYSAIAPLVTGLDIEGSQLDRMDIAVLGKNQGKVNAGHSLSTPSDFSL